MVGVVVGVIDGALRVTRKRTAIASQLLLSWLKVETNPKAEFKKNVFEILGVKNLVSQALKITYIVGVDVGVLFMDGDMVGDEDGDSVGVLPTKITRFWF